MPHRSHLLTVCLLLTSSALAQKTPAPNTGAQNARAQTAAAQNTAQSCAACHQPEASTQPETQMGRAMQVPPTNGVLNTHPNLSFRKGAYSYSVQTHNGAGVYSVTDGQQTISVPIVWSMGAQAQTWVLVRNGQLYESLVSFYPSINGLDITTGDERVTPATLEEAVGRPIGNEEAKSCFNCHATNAVKDHNLNLAAVQPGLGCEHCHLEASAHLIAMEGGSATATIPKSLGKLSSEDMSNFCGQCHRTWETVVRSRWRGEADVRFQPYRLANSKCFNGTDPRISCVACHNPHEKVVRDAAYYDSKCLACHASASAAASGAASNTAPPVNAPAAHPANASTAQAKACPVAKSNCVTCHMPRVSLPNGHLQFADHEIRIVKPGDAYPN